MAADGSTLDSQCPNTNGGISHINHNSNVTDADSVELPQITLNDLNDDCLLEIFEMVGTIDWLRLSRVSVRFQSIIATQLLTRRQIDFGDLSRNHAIRKVFRMFGAFASGIKIATSDLQYQHERRSSAEELFYLLSKYCNANRLRDLSFSVNLSELRMEYVDALCVQLTHLHRISIHSMRKGLRMIAPCDANGSVETEVLHRMLSHAKKIETIELINVPLNGDALWNNRLDTLKKVTLINCTAIDFCSFYAMMRNVGPQLQTFEWKNSAFTVKSTVCQTISDVCEIIGECMPNLIALTFEMNYAQNYCLERKGRE